MTIPYDWASHMLANTALLCLSVIKECFGPSQGGMRPLGADASTQGTYHSTATTHMVGLYLLHWSPSTGLSISPSIIFAGPQAEEKKRRNKKHIPDNPSFLLFDILILTPIFAYACQR